MVDSGFKVHRGDHPAGHFFVSSALRAVLILFPKSRYIEAPKVTQMDAANFIGKQKIKRYNTSFSRLLMLILDMSETQQLMLLNHAKDIVDKRTKPRNPCLIPVNYTLEQRNHLSFILDINAFGAYIETSQSFPVGQQITLTFFNPFSQKNIDLAGEIIWSSTYAIGVKFSNLPRHRKDMITFFAETEAMNKKVV
jgi:hypothetical protein